MKWAHYQRRYATNSSTALQPVRFPSPETTACSSWYRILNRE
jgi:hypothetical protein